MAHSDVLCICRASMTAATPRFVKIETKFAHSRQRLCSMDAPGVLRQPRLAMDPPPASYIMYSPDLGSLRGPLSKPGRNHGNWSLALLRLESRNWESRLGIGPQMDHIAPSVKHCLVLESLPGKHESNSAQRCTLAFSLGNGHSSTHSTTQVRGIGPCLHRATEYY